MSSNSSIVPLRQADTIDDPLTTILRSGARRLLAAAAAASAATAFLRGGRLSVGGRPFGRLRDAYSTQLRVYSLAAAEGLLPGGAEPRLVLFHLPAGEVADAD